ncbi:MAG TPA: GNAT family N-acetyltransferase [Solirubrobacterales bacterium]|nr:GNAT family N-acetyltransferase [Solirubrobacterales bacterium]
MHQIRDATPDDAEAIANINAAGWRAAYVGLIDRDRLANLPVKVWVREIKVNLTELSPDSFSIVAETEGRVSGSCFVLGTARDGDLPDDVAELVAIYVDPHRWRQGVGTALLREAMERCRREGRSEMSLWTLSGNHGAQAFYERHGFEPDGNEQIHPLARAPALRMRRPLG